jgi:hypothetical protein
MIIVHHHFLFLTTAAHQAGVSLSRFVVLSSQDANYNRANETHGTFQTYSPVVTPFKSQLVLAKKENRHPSPIETP